MLRRGFLRWIAAACGVLVAACGEEVRKVIQPAARFAKQGGWDAWNERRYERDLRKNGLGVYCYTLTDEGKYDDLIFLEAA